MSDRIVEANVIAALLQLAISRPISRRQRKPSPIRSSNPIQLLSLALDPFRESR